MALITKPGVYSDVSAASYHDAICTPAPALSAAAAIDLIDECAAHVWYKSPMNPAYEPTQKPEFDIGRAAHLLFLEPHLFDAGVVIIDAEDYRKGETKAARADAYLAGKTPLLTKQLDMIRDMRRALHNELPGLPFETAPSFAAKGLRGGKAEQSMFWRDEEFGIWRKARPDYQIIGALIDYKTSTTANPLDIERPAENLRWNQRAAFYIDGWKALTGETVRYWYIVQEKEAPYLTEVFVLGEEFIEEGRIRNRKAAEIFADCLRTRVWPRYPNAMARGREAAHLIEGSTYGRMRFDERSQRGDFNTKPTPAQLKASHELHRPYGFQGG